MGGLLVWNFAAAGMLKEVPILGLIPIDYTVLATLALVTVAVLQLVRTGELPLASLAIVGFFAALSPSLLWTSFDSYSLLKLGSFLLFTMTACISVPLVMRSQRAVTWMMAAFVAFSLALALDALVFRTGRLDDGRLVSLGTTIALGRFAGSALAIMFAFIVWRRVQLTVAIPAMAILFYALVGSGARGAVLAAILAVIAMTLTTSRFDLPGPIRLALLASGFLLLGFTTLRVAPEVSVERFTDASQLGSAGRTEAYTESLRLISKSPLGVGWGDYGEHVFVFSGGVRNYPHNLFLEIGTEMGWLGLVGAVILVASAFRALRLSRTSCVTEALFGLLAFTLVSVMTSGDLTDNRHFLLLCIVALHFPGLSPTNENRDPG